MDADSAAGYCGWRGAMKQSAGAEAASAFRSVKLIAAGSPLPPAPSCRRTDPAPGGRSRG
jgi:hypothetical protein